MKWHNKALYGCGNLGYGAVSQTISNFIMFFGTGVLAIPGALMGIGIAITTMWDAITDPLVGYMSDRTCSKRFGRRHGYILVATFLIAILNVALWSVPTSFPMWAKFVWLFVSLLLIETFDTVFATPYTALGTELARDYHERTSIQSHKTVFFLISLLIPSILMSVFLSPTKYITLSASSAGYIDIAWITSGLCVFCGLSCFFGTIKHRPIIKQTPKNKQSFLNIITNIIQVLKHRNYRAIILGYSISLISAAFIASIGLHAFTYTFGFNAFQIPIVMGALVLGTVLSQPVWGTVSRRKDKKPTLLLSMCVLLVGIALFSFVLIFRNYIPHDFAILSVAIPIFISGFGTGALYNLPVSMLGDCLEIDYKNEKQEKTASYSGYLTLAFKTANAVAMLIIGIMLDVIGFNGKLSSQTVGVQNWLGWLLVIGISISTVIGIMIFSKYTVTKKDL